MTQPGSSHGSGDGPPPIETVGYDAPQFQVAAAHPRRMEKAVAIAFLAALAGAAGFGAAFWVNADNFWLGATLGVTFVGLGAGFVAWGKYLMPRGPFSESRHSLVPSEEHKEQFVDEFASRGKVAIERRGFLLKIAGAGTAVFGIVAMFPLIRSLGPLPKKFFFSSYWYRGAYLVTPYGTRLQVSSMKPGGMATVFPPTDIGGPFSQTMLVRQGTADITTAPGRETWSPQGYMAFSKVCTHAGCPVGLYQQVTRQLLCPCHQSLFDVGPGRAAVPVFGPAPRPLPQLPLYVDSRGYLRAQKGYDEPVGPGFWERGNSNG